MNTRILMFLLLEITSLKKDLADYGYGFATDEDLRTEIKFLREKNEYLMSIIQDNDYDFDIAPYGK